VLRLLEGQSDEHQVPFEKLLEAEGARASQFDPRCGVRQVELMAELHRAAQARFFGSGVPPLAAIAPRVLLGPNSKVVDHLVSGVGLLTLVASVRESAGEAALLKAINDGPGNGELVWNVASTPLEFVAGVIRWGTVRGKEKCRIRATDEVRAWVAETLLAAGVDTKPRLGGVSAVGTQLSQVLGAIPTMMALGSLSPDILQYLDPKTAVVGTSEQTKTLGELPRAKSAIPNLSIQHRGAPLELPLSQCTVAQTASCHQTIGEIDIIATGNGEVPFEGLSVERSRRLGQVHDIMVLTGAHRLRAAEDTESFFEHVAAIREGGTAIALIQADPRHADNAPRILQKIRDQKVIDYWGMNGSEAFHILTLVAESSALRRTLAPECFDRLTKALASAAEPTTIWPSSRETPRWIAESALLLQEIFDVPLVRVRGRAVDLLAVSPRLRDEDLSRVRDHLIISRNLATLKVAELDGLLDDPKDLLPLRNLPDGGYVAAVRGVQDVWEARFPSSRHGSFAELQLSECGIARSETGQALIAVSPIQFYDRTGGTQSAGDTIDVSFVAMEAHGLMAAALKK
jgi:hypothetical protein